MVIHHGKWKVRKFPANRDPYERMEFVSRTLKSIQLEYEKYKETKKAKHLSKTLKLLKSIDVLSKQLANIASIVEVMSVYNYTDPLASKQIEVSLQFKPIMRKRKSRLKQIQKKIKSLRLCYRRVRYVNKDFLNENITYFVEYLRTLEAAIRSDITSMRTVVANMAADDGAHEFTESDLNE